MGKIIEHCAAVGGRIHYMCPIPQPSHAGCTLPDEMWIRSFRRPVRSTSATRTAGGDGLTTSTLDNKTR
jgi:hypothetical protein